MNYTITTWFHLYSSICLICFILGLWLFCSDSSAVLLTTCLWLCIWSFVIVRIPNLINKTEQPIRLEMKDYESSVEYKDLLEVNNCVNNGYEDKFKELDSLTYCYDYINISLIKKDISFLEFIHYIRVMDNNIVFKSESSLCKRTKPQTIDGVLKINVINNDINYVINGYALTKDEKGIISSLPNNENIKLEIVYDSESYTGNKNITKYSIIKANTNS